VSATTGFPITWIEYDFSFQFLSRILEQLPRQTLDRSPQLRKNFGGMRLLVGVICFPLNRTLRRRRA
jgi:hypothetical protein